jgi:hypothetical protein
MLTGARPHWARFDIAFLEAELAVFVEDVLLEPADNVLAIAVATEHPAPVHQRRIEEFADGSERPVVAVVWRGRRKDQGVGAAGEHFGKLATERGIAVVAADFHAVMGFVNHHHVVRGAF